MPEVQVNEVRLYYEMTGEGSPIVFVHEFAGDYRSWEDQIRFFNRRYRTVTYNARGFPPSEIPVGAAHYTQDLATDDLAGLIQYGASPRATINLTIAARANAFLDGRGYVVPQDVKDVAMDVLRHRLIVTYEAEAEEKTAEDVIQTILDHVPVP